MGIMRFGGYQDGAFEDDNNIYTRINYNIDKTSSLTFHGSHFDADANYANSLTLEEFKEDPKQNPGDKQPLDDNYNLFALVYSKDFGLVDFEIKTDYKDEETDMFWSGLYFNFDEWEIHPEASLTLRHNLGSLRNKLVLGGEYRYHKIKTLFALAPDNIIGLQLGDRKREDTSYAAYLQDELQVTDALTFTLGVRYDDYEQEQEDKVSASGNWKQSDSAFSPKVGATYTFSDAVNAFAGFNSGFKSPARVPAAAASESLDPERVYAYEGGLRGHPTSWLDYELALFWHQVKDKFVSLPDQQWENAGETRSKGVEIGVNMNFDNGLYGDLSYTYQDSEYEDYETGGVNYDGNKIANVPKQLFGARLGYYHDVFGDFSVNPTYYGDKYLDTANTEKWDGFWLLNAQYTKRFTFWKPVVELFVTGTNLSDEEEVTNADGADAVYPVPGRRFIAGINLVF
jgi:iron complex outermembrane receptor protein